MREQASIEAKKRHAHIKHHFEVSHLSGQQRDEIGFMGEFACCSLLGLDWKGNIRKDYQDVDDFDLRIKGKRADVKTETVPASHAQKIIDKSIADDALYGRRLINKGQFSILKKYDLVIFGLFIRDQLDFWYPLGYLETASILEHYPPVFERPDGGKYPFSASPVPNSKLKPIADLLPW